MTLVRWSSDHILTTVGPPAFREMRVDLQGDWDCIRIGWLEGQPSELGRGGRASALLTTWNTPGVQRHHQPWYILQQGHLTQETWPARNAAVAHAIQYCSDSGPHTKKYLLNLKGSEEYYKIHKQVKTWMAAGNLIIQFEQKVR